MKKLYLVLGITAGAVLVCCELVAHKNIKYVREHHHSYHLD